MLHFDYRAFISSIVFHIDTFHFRYFFFFSSFAVIFIATVFHFCRCFWLLLFLLADIDIIVDLHIISALLISSPFHLLAFRFLCLLFSFLSYLPFFIFHTALSSDIAFTLQHFILHMLLSLISAFVWYFLLLIFSFYWFDFTIASFSSFHGFSYTISLHTSRLPFFIAAFTLLSDDIFHISFIIFLFFSLFISFQLFLLSVFVMNFIHYFHAASNFHTLFRFPFRGCWFITIPSILTSSSISFHADISADLLIVSDYDISFQIFFHFSSFFTFHFDFSSLHWFCFILLLFSAIFSFFSLFDISISFFFISLHITSIISSFSLMIFIIFSLRFSSSVASISASPLRYFSLLAIAGFSLPYYFSSQIYCHLLYATIIFSLPSSRLILLMHIISDNFSALRLIAWYFIQAWRLAPASFFSPFLAADSRFIFIHYFRFISDFDLFFTLHIFSFIISFFATISLFFKLHYLLVILHFSSGYFT